MARYIDADALMNILNDAQIEFSDTYEGLGRAKFLLSLQPTADVVPKSEVEEPIYTDELIYKLECLLCHATGGKLSKHTYTLQVMESAVTDYIQDCCDEYMKEAKSKVVREIILEIDTLICCHANGDIDDKRLYVLFDELKKKYIGGDTNVC